MYSTPPELSPIRSQALLAACAGVGSTCSSRDGGSFAVAAGALLRCSRHQSVLNSLSHDFVACSHGLLGERGGFVEIGKRHVWSRPRQAAATACVPYEVLALDDTMAHAPEWMQHALQQLACRLGAHTVHGLPTQCFLLEEEAVAAFRLLQSGRNVGKVVLRISRTIEPHEHVHATQLPPARPHRVTRARAAVRPPRPASAQ